MDKSYLAKTPMIVRSIDLEKDVFRPRDEGEEILGVRIPISQSHWSTYVFRE